MPNYSEAVERVRMVLREGLSRGGSDDDWESLAREVVAAVRATAAGANEPDYFCRAEVEAHAPAGESEGETASFDSSWADSRPFCHVCTTEIPHGEAIILPAGRNVEDDDELVGVLIHRRCPNPDESSETK